MCGHGLKSCSGFRARSSGLFVHWLLLCKAAVRNCVPRRTTSSVWFFYKFIFPPRSWLRESNIMLDAGGREGTVTHCNSFSGAISPQARASSSFFICDGRSLQYMSVVLRRSQCHYSRVFLIFENKGIFHLSNLKKTYPNIGLKAYKRGAVMVPTAASQ